MKLRHDFAGHYNRPDIFQMHINRAAPQLYRVHNDPAALAAPETGELPPRPHGFLRRSMNELSISTEAQHHGRL